MATDKNSNFRRHTLPKSKWIYSVRDKEEMRREENARKKKKLIHKFNINE